MKRLYPYFIFLFIIISYFSNLTLNSQDHQKLEYNVAVSARIIPVFAVDAKGNPVYDIKENEIIFYVNGKSTRFQFQSYFFEDKQEISKPSPTSPKSTEKQNPNAENSTKNSQRIIFIIIDSAFNSIEGLKRSKGIALQLFQNKFPEDDFILIENTPGGGLKYIIGPEDNVERLTHSLKQVSDIPQRFDKTQLSRKTRNTPGSVDLSTSDNRHSMRARGEKLRYRNHLKRMTKSLVSLKYALKAISKPKIVYLISEGAVKGAFIESYASDRGIGHSYILMMLYDYLKDVSKAINEGGSILYSINPRKIDFENLRDETLSGEESMNVMARESGGKYFEGSDPVIVANKIQKTTAAYYELAFTITPDMGKTQNLKLKCTRPGIRIHSIKQLTNEKPYIGMTEVEKKLFALNVANQGTWSRMVAKTKQTDFKILHSEKKGKKDILSIQIKIPPHLQNKQIDIFMIRTGSKKDNIDFGLNRKTAGKTEILTFEKKKNRKHYFVIIEPATPFCIYNQVTF